MRVSTEAINHYIDLAPWHVDDQPNPYPRLPDIRQNRIRPFFSSSVSRPKPTLSSGRTTIQKSVETQRTYMKEDVGRSIRYALQKFKTSIEQPQRLKRALHETLLQENLPRHGLRTDGDAITAIDADEQNDKASADGSDKLLAGLQIDDEILEDDGGAGATINNVSAQQEIRACQEEESPSSFWKENSTAMTCEPMCILNNILELFHQQLLIHLFKLAALQTYIIQLHMKIYIMLLLMAVYHSAWTSFSNVFTGGLVPSVTASGSQITTVTFGNPWNCDFSLTYGLEGIKENKKQKMTWSTLIGNLTPTRFDITFTISLPTEVSSVRMRILLHPVNFNQILALTSVEFPQSDLSSVSMGTGQRRSSSIINIPVISFDLANDVNCLVMLQGINLDGLTQEVSLRSAMVSGSSYSVELTVDSDTQVTSLYVGIFIFDVTQLESDINIIVDYGIMTSRGLLSQFDLTSRVATVYPSSLLLGINGFSTSPYINIDIRYDGATKSWTGLQTYNVVQMSYWTILQRTACQSGYVFQSRRNDICKEICGDGIKFTLACDDGNNIDDDGCSADCQVEINATCVGGSATSADICTVKRYFDAKLILTMKHFDMNRVSFLFQLFPQRSQYAMIDYAMILSTNVSGTLAPRYQDGLLIVDLDYNTDIHNAIMELTLDMKLSNLKYFSGNDKLIATYTVIPDNNLVALSYPTEAYEQHNQLDIILTVIMILTLILYIGGLFIRKYIGVQLIAVVQVAYIGMAMMDDWSPLMSVYARLNEVNGLNIGLDDRHLIGSPRRLLGMDIGYNFVYDFNISQVILSMPYVVAAILYLLSKKWPHLLQYSSDALCIYGLSAVLLVLYHWGLSFWAFVLYTKQIEMPLFVQNVLGLVLSVALIVPILVLFGKHKDKFGDFTTGLNQNSRYHYWILIGGRVLLPTILVAGITFPYIGFVCCLLPFAMIVWLAVRKPYTIMYDNFRAIGNEVTMLLIMVVYTYYGGFVAGHGEKMHDILPYFIVAFLFLCLLMNLVLLLAILYKKLRDKMEDEEDLRLVRMCQQENEMNQELNKRTVGMVRQRRVKVKEEQNKIDRMDTSRIDMSRLVNEKSRRMDMTMMDTLLPSARLKTPQSNLLEVPQTNRSRIDQLLRQIPHNKSVLRTKQQLSDRIKSTVGQSQKRATPAKRQTLSQFTKKLMQK